MTCLMRQRTLSFLALANVPVDRDDRSRPVVRIHLKRPSTGHDNSSTITACVGKLSFPPARADEFRVNLGKRAGEFCVKNCLRSASKHLIALPSVQFLSTVIPDA